VSARRAVLLLSLSVAVPALGCDTSTGPSGPAADVLGTWTYTGTQAAPARELVGTLVITNQTGGQISGSLTWEERDGIGGVDVKSSPLSGRVIGLEDTDFDALHPEGTRRHVARISANGDTIVGVWIASSLSRNGNFRALRSAAP
jgi:hypothetical protein